MATLILCAGPLCRPIPAVAIDALHRIGPAVPQTGPDPTHANSIEHPARTRSPRRPGRRQHDFTPCLLAVTCTACGRRCLKQTNF
jgi:hypothetical protein